jgi:class 3 adenylate cyclase/HAMP domain-containing protein
MRLANSVVDAVARVPARVHSKLLFAFLAIVATLIVLGAVGLGILSGMNERNEELIALQRKIAAYRNLQHDTTRQLYGVTSALLVEEERRLDNLVRQLSQFGYNLDRLQLVEEDEAELLAAARADYNRFLDIVTEVVELARSGQVDAARKLQFAEARPLANRLERLTNQLVNVAEANMLDQIEVSKRAYDVSRIAVISVAFGSVILALILGYVFSSSIIRPLAQIKARLGEIAGGDFGHSIEVSNRDELGALAADINRTSRELGDLYRQIEDQKSELEDWNETLQQRVTEQVEEIARIGRLRRFLSPQVADLIVSSGGEKQLESHRREITALFCDLRGFTGFSESADPEDVMMLLRAYHAAIGKIIHKYEGTLERFAGDGVMVIFNDPVPLSNPALQAVKTAIAMREAMDQLVNTWNRMGHELGFGIGISHGYATLGTIGFEGRFDYAAIGTVANVASRLCDEAKSGQILISARVLIAVEDVVTVEQAGEFALKGIRRPVTVYNVLGSAPPSL